MNAGDMSEAKDPAIKLFGRTIPLQESQIPAKSSAGCQIPDKSEKMVACSEITRAESNDLHAEDSGKPNKSSVFKHAKEECQTPMQVNGVQLNPQPKEDQAETDSTGQEKVFKKPDKILPCPRCNSLDTKFCYFNNYNVNQPRHFCKNCQRYWTAGGTMRNVPVGAGRRKNKNLASQYHQIMVSSDNVPTTRLETPDLASPQLLACRESLTPVRPSTGNGMVLKFGLEAPLCESVETVLNLEDQKRPVNCGENGEDPSSCGSSTTTSSFRENELPEKVMKKLQDSLPGSCNDPTSLHPLNCYPVPPWVFPCSPGWNNVAPMAAARCSSELVFVPDSTNPNPLQWCSTPIMAVPGFGGPSIPLPYVPASYWGCMPVWPAGTGNMMLGGSNACRSPPSSASNCCSSGNMSPALGKHSRDANSLEEEKSEKGILVPKTLRFDHLNEASKSPIWATLGSKPDRKDPLSKGGIFRAFEPKSEAKGHVSETTQILEANPAALSRSQTFQENR